MAESKKELEDHVLVTHDPISCDAAAQIVHSDSAGATSMFIGECGLRSVWRNWWNSGWKTG